MESTRRPRLRFLVVGPIVGDPTNIRRPLTPSDLTERLAAAPPTIDVDVGPALGAAGPLPARAAFPRLRAFARREVIATTAPLAELARLAERAAAARDRPAIDAVVAAVRSIVGDGPLHAALAGAVDPPPTSAAAGDDAGDDDLVGLLLAGHARRSGAAAAIDGFIAATAGSTARASAQGAPASASAAATIAASLREAVQRAAATILDAPPIAAIERRIRALRLLLEAAPRGGDVAIEHLDVGGDTLAPALHALADEDPWERPDLVVVVDPIGEVAEIEALAAAGADLQAPIVVELDPTALGRPSLVALARDLADDAATPAEWQALRELPGGRWLALAVNPPVLAVDADDRSERACIGGAAATVAAALAGSWGRAGTFVAARRGDGLRAPALHRSPGSADPSDARARATAELLTLADLRALAGHGLLAIASAAGDDRIGLERAPILGRADPPTNLPLQLVIGRTARFCQWAADALAGPADAASLAAAAALHLLPGAAILPAIAAGHRRLRAEIPAALAGVAASIEFALGREG